MIRESISNETKETVVKFLKENPNSLLDEQKYEKRNELLSQLNKELRDSHKEFHEEWDLLTKKYYRYLEIINNRNFDNAPKNPQQELKAEAMCREYVIKLNELWDELFDVEIETLKDKLEQKKLNK